MSEGWSTLQHHSQAIPLSLSHACKQNQVQTVWQMWKMALFTSGYNGRCERTALRVLLFSSWHQETETATESKEKIMRKNSRSPFSSIRTYTPTKECVSRKQQQRCCQQRWSALIGSDQFEKNHHNSHSIRFDWQRECFNHLEFFASFSLFVINKMLQWNDNDT